MSAPETNLGVYDEPEQRDWQLHEQNERREPADGSHARILIEPALERKQFSSGFRTILAPRSGH
jgi:hypothetical protein